MILKKILGDCLPLFFVAIIFDVIGLIVLFVGIFANLRIDGRFYGDFLIYTGALIIFVSLAFWLMWYIGNIHVSEYESMKKKSSIVLLARKISERLSQKLKGEDRVKCVKDDDCSQVVVGSPTRKASRVTWGKSTAYHNEGYEESVDPPDMDNEDEKDVKQNM